MTVYVIVTPKEGEKFTEFYVLGSGGKAEDYPTNLKVGEDQKLEFLLFKDGLEETEPYRSLHLWLDVT